MSTITYRTADGKVIGGYQRDCCDALYGEVAAHASDDITLVDETAFATFGVCIADVYREHDDPADREQALEDARDAADSEGLLWEQVAQMEARREADVCGWWNFKREWEAANHGFPFVLMEDGTVWEELEGGGGLRFAFDALDPDVFVAVDEATPEQAARLPERGSFRTSGAWWPTEWADDSAEVIQRIYIYDADGELHETPTFYRE